MSCVDENVANHAVCDQNFCHGVFPSERQQVVSCVDKDIEYPFWAMDVFR